MLGLLKAWLKRVLPSAPRRWAIASYRLASPHEVGTLAAFAFGSDRVLSRSRRLRIAWRMLVIPFAVETAHTHAEAVEVVRAILAVPKRLAGCIVEAGTYKGASAAKYSLAAAAVGRDLVLFDSFEGVPDHDEAHDENIFGRPASFPAGSYAGTLDEVQRTISRFGDLSVCRFEKGWFDITMPRFHDPIAVAYIDVDLASSTKTCLKHLFPLIVPGGRLYSQDGHLPLVLEVFDDDSFWCDEVGGQKPKVHGLGARKLIYVEGRPATPPHRKESH